MIPPYLIARQAAEARREMALSRQVASQQRQIDWQRLRTDQAITQARMAAAQAAQAQAVQQATQIVQAAPPAPTPAPTPTPPQISPASPEADLRPTQDAADGGEAAAAEAGPAPEKHHVNKKHIIIGVVLVGAGVGGYLFVKNRKKNKPKGA
jgi:hypothetical protein